MTTLVTEQITSFIAIIQHGAVFALGIAFTIAVLAMLLLRSDTRAL